ncbi:MAG: hypothetical protein AAFQ67_02995 [Pseudomonadota bacterium]
MSVLDPFRDQVRDFLERHGIDEEEFGKEAANDPNFCRDLFAGEKAFQTSVLERVSRWMLDRDEDAGSEAPRPPRQPPRSPALDRTFGEFDYDRRMEIYKVMVDSVERGIDRRQALNRFYFSVVIAIFVSISFVLQSENDELPARTIVSGALFLATANCLLWLFMIFASRRLSASKYDVICEMETELEYAPFSREWEIHVAKGRNFPQFTLIEIMLPASLGALCSVFFLMIAFGIVIL